MDFDRMNSAGYLINHLARLFAAGLRNRIEPLGIVPGQFATLLELWMNDGQTQKELVKKLDLEQATLANTLARMERDGLITRREHPTDGRARIVRLTEKARDIRKGAYEAAQATNEAALSSLSGEEREQFNNIMRKIIVGMKNDE
ncbi:MarR family winged helix-turn-helix transcriptional regulator [Sneathiella sp.]|uniref:MarR family winged helix-turn-helix transcriptional regulator n=1 Tax=Sneathiella sp. TaxID=1964365 RepID=UPI003FA704A8